MDTAQQSFGLQVSQEEVWCLLKLLNIPAIPGCAVPADDSQSPDVMAALYGAAENSLIAQDVMRIALDETQPEGYRRQLDQRAAALVGSGARAEQILTLTLQSRSGLSSTAWIYFARGLQVLHTIHTGVAHRFIALMNGDMILSAVGSALQLRSDTQPVNKGIDIRVHGQAFNAAQQEIQAQNAGGAVEVLQNAGLQQDVAEYLVRALMDTLRVGHVDWLVSADNRASRFSFLETSQHYYWLLPEGEDFRIRQAELTNITGEIVRLIKEAKQASR